MLLNGDDKMSLFENINNDIKEAMKNKDKEKLNVVRMLKSAIQMAQIELKHELSDDEIINVISKQIKMRKDSIQEFTKAGRDNLKDQYQHEIDILNTYMPEQLSNEEVTKIIDEVFARVKPTDKKQMGLIIKEVSPKVKGRYDMGEVSKIIKEKLDNL